MNPIAEWVSKDGRRVEVSEASLSRVWQNIEDDKYNFAIISASIPKYSDDANLERSLTMRGIARDKRWGVTDLEGGYTYQDGPQAGETHAEPSILVHGPTKAEALALGRAFQQESIIWKDADQFAVLRCEDGAVVLNFKLKAGRENMTLNQDVIKQAYSALIKGSHQKRKFAFTVESVSALIRPQWAMAMGGFRRPAKIDITSEAYAQKLEESSLSRIRQWMLEHDCAVITGFRGKLEYCHRYSCKQDQGKEMTRAENEERTHQIKMALMSFGWGVTAVDGRYVENFPQPGAEPCDEPALFVVNLNNHPEFFPVIKKLGIEYCQDSVFIKPKGGMTGELFGTNHAKLPGWEKSVPLEKPLWGVEAMFTTRIRNRPFTMPLKSNESVQSAIGIDAMRNHGWSGAVYILGRSAPLLKRAGITAVFVLVGLVAFGFIACGL